jgi:hypothetical protein
MREGFHMVAGTLSAIQEDLRGNQGRLPPSVRTGSEMEFDVGDLKKHVLRIERKVGLAK